jgi:DNA polymerase-1
MGKNEILNSGIQGVASDVVTDAMNRLSDLSWELKKPQYRPIMNIHDDLTFIVSDDTLEDDIEFIAKEMCKVRFDWITVPIGVEVGVGKKWSKIQDIQKYDTRDFTY